MEKKADETMYVPYIRIVMVKEKEFPYTAEMMNEPKKVAAFAKTILSGADREYLLVISVDVGSKPTAVETVAIGTLNGALAEPREIFKHAVLANAFGIIMVHNHTSGRCVPSDGDIRLTERIEAVGNLLGIPLLDHIIIGDGYFSFLESGLLEPSQQCAEKVA